MNCGEQHSPTTAMQFDLRSLWHYSRAVVEPGTPRRAVRRVRYVLKTRDCDRLFRERWQAAENAALRRRLADDPRLAGFSVWPFMNRGLPPAECIDRLAKHWSWREQTAPWTPAHPSAAPICMVDLDGQLAGLGLWLEYAPWFIREGALNLTLMLHQERLITLSFAMSSTPQGLEACIGSIQGSNRADAVELYKQVADALHDLRPRDLIIKAFRLLAQCLGADTLACVADDCHAQLHPYFGGTKAPQVSLHLDELWKEQGGIRDPDGFFRMPARSPERPLSSVPTKKRGRYKRRLEMFASWQTEIERRIQEARQACRQ